MTEAGVALLPTAGEYLQQLKSLQASVASDFQYIQRKLEILELTLRAEHRDEEPAAAAAAAEVTVPRMRPEDVTALVAVENLSKQMRRQIGERQIGEVISRHVRIDVGHLYELGMGGVIHDFRPLSAETLKLSMSDLFKDASQGDDFRLCLKVGADVNELAEGQTAVIRAVCANNMEAFEMILSDHPDLEVKAGKVPKGTGVRDVRKGNTVVIVACRLRRWEMVRSLIAKGANVNARGGDGRKALQVACETAERQLDTGGEECEWIRPNYNPQKGDPAVRSTVSAALKDLLVKTSDVADLRISPPGGREDESLIHFFSWHEFEDLLLLSLEKGVDINAVDDDDNSALINATMRARPAYVQILVNNGTRVNVPCRFGTNPIRMAIPGGIRHDSPHTRKKSFITSVRRVLEILLNHGADVNAHTQRAHSTPLHHAVKWGVIGIVRLLVQRGANLQLRDRDEKTPHELAVQLNRSSEMKTLLVPAGASAD